MKYQLMKDDDGHWFVCPLDKVEDVIQYFDAVYDYWVYDKGELRLQPDYLIELKGGYNTIVFSDFEML